jgi:transcription elongation factor Elf1
MIELQGIKLYTVDLTKVNGEGEFRCPKCGIEISPNDKTEDVYTILETVMKKDYLEKIVLQCNSCGSQIHLVGFHLLNKLR